MRMKMCIYYDCVNYFAISQHMYVCSHTPHSHLQNADKIVITNRFRLYVWIGYMCTLHNAHNNTALINMSIALISTAIAIPLPPPSFCFCIKSIDKSQVCTLLMNAFLNQNQHQHFINAIVLVA